MRSLVVRNDAVLLMTVSQIFFGAPFKMDILLDACWYFFFVVLCSFMLNLLC
jgi:hypothetical protein